MADAPGSLDWAKPGLRVIVRDKNLEGTIRFVGETEFAPGVWVGVELDEAKGKNNGSVKGKAYFECEDQHGLMVRSHQLEPLGSLLSEEWARPGMRVLIKEKNLEGTVRFFGETEFAPGKWVGVELDEPKGKNNGTVKDKAYFECREKHGLMVRIPQVEPLGEIPASSISQQKKRIIASSAKSPAGSPSLKRSQMPKPGKSGAERSTTPLSVSPKAPQKSPKEDESVKQPVMPECPIVVSVDSGAPEQVLELQQRVAVLQQKRAEDKAKMKELEKFRLQYQQMVEYKAKWTESQSELQQQLKKAKKEARDAQLTKEQVEDELRELSDAVEIATLDKEMAEEKCEGLQAENEALKERIQELSMDLEILQNEISESGYEGAAASGQLKQLEQQNSRLKEALMRLRDVSNEEKAEHQQLVKDFEKQTQALTQITEQKDRLEEELKAADEFISTLKEQVDVAMGAEEMVEKLTEQNLQLEEDLSQMTETVSDLEALRELSEQQEEIRVEVEHELREELDMNMNNVRQMERRLEASQETIVDQQQTIEKFRELVRQLQGDVSELRKQPKEEGQEEAPPIVAPDSMLSQLKSSAVQAYSRTIDYELRKLESQQSVEIINYFKSFMPNSFLVSGGDYDAVNVVMLLPRLVFKSELIIDQLRQQTNLDDILASPQPNSKLDVQTFAAFLIYKLTTLQQLTNMTIRILCECDVQLYRQMGGLRDDLILHEKALDILIELLKKEQLDESVLLNGVEKAIHHFENLLTSRLSVSPQCGKTDLFQDQVKLVTSGCDYCTLELLRLQCISKDATAFVNQVKELGTFNNDIRQICRKARRRLPTPQSGKILVCPEELFPRLISQQQLIVTDFRALYSKVYQRNQSLSDNEVMSSAELEELLNEMSKSVFQEQMSKDPAAASSDGPVHFCLTKMVKDLEQFLVDLQDGTYDALDPKLKLPSPLSLRAQAVKDELSDTEGLRYKMEEKNAEIVELKKVIKLKCQEIGENITKMGLLEKKLEQVAAECSRKLEEEKMETERVKTVMEQQQEKFNRALEVLQKDIESLEEERDNLKQQIENQSRTPIPADISNTRRSMSLSGRQALASLMSRSPAHVHRSQTTPTQASTSSVSEGTTDQPVSSNSPLLLAQIESLRKALGYVQDDNIKLRAHSAQVRLASLPRLNVPKTLVAKREKDEEGNRSDVEKSLAKRTSDLLQDLKAVLGQTCVVDITKKEKDANPREILAQQMSALLELKQRSAQLKEDTAKVVASNFPGGLVQTRVKTFLSPQFSKTFSEGDISKQLLARFYLPPSREAVGGSCRKLVVSANQFQALHASLIT